MPDKELVFEILGLMVVTTAPFVLVAVLGLSSLLGRLLSAASGRAFPYMLPRSPACFPPSSSWG